LSSFEAFIGTGAVTNSGTFTGDVGTNVGALTGFTGPYFTGAVHFNDALTAQAELDLLKVYIHLNNIVVKHLGTHAPAFGNETLTPDVYAAPGAGSLAGTITLDGRGDDDAIFIFKFNGAFAAAALSKVIFTNKTRRCNVFWISEGAASIGAFRAIKGTILAHGGTATMAAGGNLEGRLLSKVGAIGFSTGVVYTVVHDVECLYPLSQKPSGQKMAASAPTSIINNLLNYPNPSKGVFKIKLKNTNIAV
jgi:hypothetical protein